MRPSLKTDAHSCALFGFKKAFWKVKTRMPLNAGFSLPLIPLWYIQVCQRGKHVPRSFPSRPISFPALSLALSGSLGSLAWRDWGIFQFSPQFHTFGSRPLFQFDKPFALERNYTCEYVHSPWNNTLITLSELKNPFLWESGSGGSSDGITVNKGGSKSRYREENHCGRYCSSLSISLSFAWILMKRLFHSASPIHLVMPFSSKVGWDSGL